LQEPAVIVENAKRKTVTIPEAKITQVVNQAASGKLKALQLLATLVRSAKKGESKLRQLQALEGRRSTFQCEH